ncbi:type II and III secretion system protein [Rhodothermus sp. AH-315-K08]|nr:type II and III secretion system protein [Rhodothermus sp. AH-315-K08]
MGLVGGVPDIGGAWLHYPTSGEALQRLLIVYDPDDPAPAEQLMNLLSEQIDLPARQILIEAMVIEVSSDRISDIGFQTRYGRDERNDLDGNSEEEVETYNQYGGTLERDSQTGNFRPFTFIFDNLRGATATQAVERFFGFTLEALITEGDAEILSRPSVLALDGRQARIQVGQQVPVAKSTSTSAGIINSVDYFPVGIVLNLKPRINARGDEISMQVETIVSSINAAPGISGGGGVDVFFAPFIDNRQVQTFVRVANDTPFIIGGLIKTEEREVRTGIPFLSKIPLLGRLFQSTSIDRAKREVIIVLTPHVIPLDNTNFSYVIPKDGDLFDSFDYALFRNAYRVRDDDLFDLRFIDESPVYQELLNKGRAFSAENLEQDTPEELRFVLEGHVPGEDILIRRMLWEIVNKIEFHEHITPDQVLIFEEDPDSGTGSRSVFLSGLLQNLETRPENTLNLTFEAVSSTTRERPFQLPTATVGYESSSAGTFYDMVDGLNAYDADDGYSTFGLPITTYAPPGVRGASALEVLMGALVLKRVLTLNADMPLTLDEFKVGREIILPTEEDLKNRFHIVDREIAQFVHEIYYYYPAFERAFNSSTRELFDLLDGQD